MEYILEEKRYVVLDENKQEIGEMTWSNAGENIMIIDHTFVDDAYRGQGIAEKLVALGVELAREKQKKIMPLCPYAAKEFDQKPEYKDVLN